MIKKSGKHVLLLLILVFAFLYRFSLMAWNTFPPGADIGLHESVIKSITVGNQGFFWNYYHMGGGVSVTNPGYHIFVISVIAMTGAPDYVAQSIVASFFSALIVLCAFLFVRSAWNESASFIAAFLVAFSGGDIAILIWGGYPNVVTLMLIPVIFYLLLQRSKFSTTIYLAASSLLIGAMFLTHIFSALVFVTITTVTLLVAAGFPRKIGMSRIEVIHWLLPVALGAILVSPYLLRVVPVYFGPEGSIADAASAMKQALLETRLISINVVYLSLIPFVLFFVLSKIYKGKFFTIQSVLSAVWIIVPALLTQSYLLGVYLDYERFLYFLFLPIIICVALLIQVGANAFSRMLSRLRNIRSAGSRRVTIRASRGIMYSAFVLGLLLFSIFTVPLFTTPNAGIAETNSYQAMTHPGYEAIEWIKTHTPPGSVFVADAYFGWWLSGFAERPTLSAVDPQYLILAHEFKPAKVAGNILATNYFIDNGFIRINQNSPAADSNPDFSAWLNDSYVPYRFFSLNESEIDFVYRDNNVPSHFTLASAPSVKMRVENHSDYGSFLIARENQFFNYTEETTLYRGTKFAKISITLQAKAEGVNFDWLHLPFQQKGKLTQYPNTIASTDANAQAISQIIFPEEQLGTSIILRENPNSYELVYSLEGKTTAQAQFFVGLTQYQTHPENTQAEYLQSLIINNTKTYLEKASDSPLDLFDYKTSIAEWNISYVVIRDAESVPRLERDPFFNLVFRNSEVAIFEVKNHQKPAETQVLP